MATIRSMAPADYPIIATISGQAAERALVGRPVWESAADIAAEVAAYPDLTLIVAEDDDGSIAGMAGFRLTAGGEAELYGPLVRTEGHGIGAWLEQRLLALARQQGATAFSMLIGLTNREGATWADWLGYLPDSEESEQVLAWIYPGELEPAAAPPDAQVVVRRAGAGDLDRIHALYQACYRLERVSRDEWADRLQRCTVAEQDGAVVGFLELDPVLGWIEHFGVDPARRRQGLGGALLSHALQRFWETSPRKLGLAVPLDNTAPVSLFRRLGFRREIPVAKWMKR